MGHEVIVLKYTSVLDVEQHHIQNQKMFQIVLLMLILV